MDADTAAELETALAGLRHDRYGYYGAVLRDQLLRALPGDAGVRPLEYRVLRFVDAEPPGVVTVSHVAELLICDRARASRIVHRLVDAGLLTLHVPSSDARQRRLMLAPAGHELLAGAASARRRHLLAALADWAEHDVRTLARLLARLNADAARHAVPSSRPLR